METLAKIVRAMFLDDDSSVNINIAVKMRYVVYGIVLGVALTFGWLCSQSEDGQEEAATEIVQE